MTDNLHQHIHNVVSVFPYGIKYQYLSRYCPEVRNSSIVTGIPATAQQAAGGKKSLDKPCKALNPADDLCCMSLPVISLLCLSNNDKKGVGAACLPIF